MRLYFSLFVGPLLPLLLSYDTALALEHCLAPQKGALVESGIACLQLAVRWSSSQGLSSGSATSLLRREQTFILRNSCQAINGRKRAKDMNKKHHLGLVYEPTIQCSWQDKTPTRHHYC